MLVPILATTDSDNLAQLDDSEKGIQRAFELVDGSQSKIYVDKHWESILDTLNGYPPYGVLALYGVHNVSVDPPVSYSTDNELSNIVEAIYAITPEALDNTSAEDALEDLRKFYSSATERGESIIIVWN